VVLATCAFALGCGDDDETKKLRVDLNYPRSLTIGFERPQASPPGADDRSCKPSDEHPQPVVLVHGTFNNRASTWNALAPLLSNDGYCVFSLNFGARKPGSTIGAVTSIDGSAVKLADFVDRVLADTGADTVDIVGYSQGGMLPRQYLKFHGGATKVSSLVALAPSNHGTNANFRRLLERIAQTRRPLRTVHRRAVRAFLARLERSCQACEEQLAGSRFLKRLNEPPETLPHVKYTVIATKFDQVLTPYRQQFLAPGPNVRNITLQDECKLDEGDHLSMPFDSVALGHVTNALDPDDAVTPRCTRVRKGIGG